MIDRQQWNNLLGTLALAAILLHAAFAVGAGGVCLCGIGDGRHSDRGGPDANGCCPHCCGVVAGEAPGMTPLCPCRADENSPCPSSACPCQIGLPATATDVDHNTRTLLPSFALPGDGGWTQLPHDDDQQPRVANLSLLASHTAPLRALLCVWRN